MNLPTCNLQTACVQSQPPLRLSYKQLLDNLNSTHDPALFFAHVWVTKSFTTSQLTFPKFYIFSKNCNIGWMEPEATLHVIITWRYVMLSEKPALILKCNKYLFLWPITTGVILTNKEDPYITTNSVRVNNSTTSHDPFLLVSLQRPP